MIALLKKVKRYLKNYRDQQRFRNLISKTRPLKLIVGAGGQTEPGWIATNRDKFDLLNPTQWKKYIPYNAVDSILAEHVWEHLTEKDGRIAAMTCYQFLKPNGYLRVAVPDGNHPDKNYINYVRPGGEGPGADDHKELYDYQKFKRVFEAAGFKVKLLEYFDEKGEFHFNDWSVQDGKIHRSKRYDDRNKNGSLAYTSIILDAIKEE